MDHSFAFAVAAVVVASPNIQSIAAPSYFVP